MAQQKLFDDLQLEPPYTQSDLENIASRQLKPSPIPPGYIEELRQHLDFFPHDYLFQLALPPRSKSYGVINCLEPGCSTTPFSLDQKPTNSHYSKSIGLGRFARFQAHISGGFHEVVRDRRLALKAKHMLKKDDKVSNLSTSDRVDLKPCLPPSAVTTPSSSSKRALPSPSSSREKKKSRLQENAGHPGNKATNPMVIDVDSYDMADSKPQKPICIDIDSTDSDISVISANNLLNNQAGPSSNRDNATDEDNDTIWIVGKGFVPLSQFGKPKSRTQTSPQSRLSTEVSAALKSTMNETKPQISPSDRKFLEQAFEIEGDRAMPVDGLPPARLFSSTYGRSSLCRAVGRAVDPLGLRVNPSNPYLCHGLTPYSPYPISLPIDSWGSGLVDWHPGAMGASSSRERLSNDLDTMYDDVFARIPHLFPSRTSAVDSSMPYHEPQLRPEELQDFYKRAVQNIDFAHNATVADARKDLNIGEDDDARMDGLSVRLMPHQLIAVSWMISQEKSKNSGGILGDEMGLGKTIQMIATIVKNCSTDPKNKATLILAPLALLTQWREEIMDKSARKWKVMIYHPSYTKLAERKNIAGYDIVITTLDTLRNEWDDGSKANSSKKTRGLFNIEWYRVVIDEAQIIRNRTAKKSRAVCALKATYRWCLTGTPIFNTLWDIYPYLRFIRIRPYNDVDEFRTHIAKHEKKRPNLATKRAQAILATCMLRRQKDSKLDGQPLINLPPKKIEDIMLELSPDERDVYNMLEKQAQKKFNVFLRRGTVLKNFACILVLLLRLRQACGHPSLTIEDSKLEPEAEDSSSDPISELERAVKTLGQDWVDNTKKKFQTEAEELVEAEQKNPSQAAAPECPICNDLLDDTSRITKCGHVFCQGCIETLLAHSDLHMDEDRHADPKSIQKPCPNCRRPFRLADTYLKKAFLPPAEELEDDDDSTPVVGRKMRKGVVVDSDEDEPSTSRGTTKPSKKGKEKAVLPPEPDLVPSTKMVWLMEEIVRVNKEHPTDKIIVISQWTAMLSLCADFLRARGHRYVQYQGSMKNLEREEAVMTFKKQPNVSIMLMSLKCGGVGLNLTCANRVVSLDLAWSPASEKQAFDRTHRLGQVKDVFVKRVMIKDTVEQRICELQNKKQDITDNALGEGTGKKLKRITVGELANLFNLNVHGEALS